MFCGYKLKCFTAVCSVFWAGTLLLLLSLTSVAPAQQLKSKLWGSGTQDTALSETEVTKSDLQRLKMELEKVSQERNEYRRMVSVLKQRVDKLSRRLKRAKAMESNDKKEFLDIIKKNKKYAEHISELEQENKKLKNRLKKQTEKPKEQEEGETEDINLTKGDLKVNKLKIKLMEHIEMVKRLRGKIAELTEEK